MLIAFSLLFLSCKKEKEVTPTVNNYFSVESATLIHKNMPEPTMDEKITVAMNGTVIPGGSSIVSILSQKAAQKIFVGMKGQDGYYEVLPSTQGFAFLMMFNQDVALEEGESGFTIQVAIEDKNGDISQVSESTVALLPVGTGQLQVSLSFDHSVDLDLILVEPNGNQIGYFTDGISSNGGVLDLDSNYGCVIDGINNENITYSESAIVEPGLYQVYVDLNENCADDKPTHFAVAVYYQGELMTVTSGSNPYTGSFAADAPGNHAALDNIEPVIKFVIPDSGQKRK